MTGWHDIGTRPAEYPARMTERSSGLRAWTRTELSRLLEILALTGFAVAQPVLDVFGRSPETFVFRGAGPVEVVGFALLVTAVPPVALWAAAQTGWMGGHRGRAVSQALVLGVLLVIVATQVLKRLTPLLGAPLVLGGTVAGAAVTVAFVRRRGLRAWLRWLALAPVVFVLLFLLVSPVSRLLRPAPAATSGGRAAPVPVVMIILDEFPLLSLVGPDGRIAADRFPSFGALSRGSTWFRNYTTIERHTLFAVPTMLTGTRIEDRSKAPVASDHPDNLFTLLEGTHDLEVFETLTGLCASCGRERPQAERRGGLTALVRDAAGIWGDLSLPERVTRDVSAQFADEGNSPRDPGRSVHGLRSFKRFTRALKRHDRPALYFLHLMLPHTPWRTFPSGVRYETPGGNTELPLEDSDLGPVWSDEPWPVQLTRQRHLLQVAYTDRLVGQLIRRLKETGLYDRSLVIITSDHGVGLHPGRPHRLTATRSNLHEVLWVPLFVKTPGQRAGRIDDRNVDATDLLPTIADVLGTPVPWHTDGRSLLDPSTDRGPVKSVIVYRDREPEGTLRITVPQGQRRLRAEAFVPQARLRDPAMWAYSVGPGAPHIGRPVSRYTAGPPWPRPADVELPGDLGSVDPEQGPLPAFVWGTLAAPEETGGRPLVMALNGRIAAVSPLWTQDGRGRFAGLLPEHFFRPGRNDLRLFVLDSGTLRPVTFPRR